MRIILVNNGQAQPYAPANYSNTVGAPLTALGVKQVEATANYLAGNYKFDRLYTGTWVRTIETAKTLSMATGLVSVENPFLIEPPQNMTGVVSSVEQLRMRAANFLDQVMRENRPDATILVVTHADMIHHLMHTLLRLGYGNVQDFHPEDGAFHDVRVVQGFCSIQALNCNAHLTQVGLASTQNPMPQVLTDPALAEKQKAAQEAVKNHKVKPPHVPLTPKQVVTRILIPIVAGLLILIGLIVSLKNISGTGVKEAILIPVGIAIALQAGLIALGWKNRYTDNRVTWIVIAIQAFVCSKEVNGITLYANEPIFYIANAFVVVMCLLPLLATFLHFPYEPYFNIEWGIYNAIITGVLCWTLPIREDVSRYAMDLFVLLGMIVLIEVKTKGECSPGQSIWQIFMFVVMTVILGVFPEIRNFYGAGIVAMAALIGGVKRKNLVMVISAGILTLFCMIYGTQSGWRAWIFPVIYPAIVGLAVYLFRNHPEKYSFGFKLPVFFGLYAYCAYTSYMVHSMMGADEPWAYLIGTLLMVAGSVLTIVLPIFHTNPITQQKEKPIRIMAIVGAASSGAIGLIVFMVSFAS